jgi:putative transposase
MHRSFSGEIISATIKREADANYYISLNVNVGETAVPLKPHTEAGTVGVDVGLHHLASLSTGDFKDLPDTSRSESRIQFLKKRLSLEKPGSRRYKRTAIQIARLHHHLANITNDRHCKIAAELCAGFDTICMETLAVQGMKRGQRERRGQLTVTVPTAPGDIAFNSQLHRAALASLKDRVERKAADTGTNFVAIDRFEPTSKTCHVCGHVLDSIDLDTRKWTCPECGTHHDRDLNAAINIRRKGIELLQARKPASRQIETLPLAEGNDKPAKETATGCDLRTGKGTTRYNRPPKAQIAGGTAPPRIFNRPRLADNHPFRYFKISPLGRMAGLPSYTVKKCIEENIFNDPAPEETETVIKLLKAIKTVASSLRQLRITSSEQAYENLGLMNKVARIDWAIRDHIIFKTTFTAWRAQPKSDVVIDYINNIASVEFPNTLDAIADQYLCQLLPRPKVEPVKKMNILRRERKNDTLITPSNDPKLLAYEDQLLTVIAGCFIVKQCHISNDTFNKIVGKGTIFRPFNCTRTRMCSFVDVLFAIANKLAGFDGGMKGQKERMDQLYDINMQYVKLDEITLRYIEHGNLRNRKYFTRAGKYAPLYYNEHYHDIMRVIIYDLPALIRESAAYLIEVYQLKDVV